MFHVEQHIELWDGETLWVSHDGGLIFVTEDGRCAISQAGVEQGVDFLLWDLEMAGVWT